MATNQIALKRPIEASTTFFFCRIRNLSTPRKVEVVDKHVGCRFRRRAILPSGTVLRRVVVEAHARDMSQDLAKADATSRTYTYTIPIQDIVCSWLLVISSKWKSQGV